MKSFEGFCKEHSIDVEAFPELQPPMWNEYRKYRAGQTVTHKTVMDAIQTHKRKQADEQGAQVPQIPLSQIVTGDLAASRKVLKT
jgi:hypothetical protein